MKIGNAWTSTKNFFRKLGKKNIVIGCCVMLIGAAVVLNWALFGQTPEKTGFDYSASAGMSYNTQVLSSDTAVVGANKKNNKDDYFSTSLVNRQRARDEAIEVLQGVVDNEGVAEEAKAKAMSEISQIALDMDNESKIETLIESKGFEKCVAVVSGGTASVIVKSEGLMDNQISQINEIVYDQTGILPDNVKIIQK